MTEPFRLTRQVEFHETDQAGIMHFSNYFRWMESAEHALLRSVGVAIHTGHPGPGWPRAKATCEYRAPLSFGDVVEISVKPERVGNTSMTWQFTFTRTSDGTVVATGAMTTVHVQHDAHGRMTTQPVPDALRRLGSREA